MKTFKQKLHECPICLHEMDRCMAYKGDVPPRPGDVTICIRCCTLLLFDEDLDVILPNEEELKKLLKDPDVQGALLAAQRLRVRVLLNRQP